MSILLPIAIIGSVVAVGYIALLLVLDRKDGR